MQHPALNPDVLLFPVENGYLTCDPATRQLHMLNPLAALIVELCDGSRSVDEVRALVGPLLPEGQASQVDNTIDEAAKIGVLRVNGSAGLAPHRDLTPDELADLAQKLRSEQGHILGAYLCQQRAAELAVNDADKWCYAGDLAHILGRRDDTRAAYERYLALEPDDAEVKLLLVALRDQPPPPRVPDECIQQLYQRFSSFYEKNVVGELSYEGPQHMGQILAPPLDGRPPLAMLDLGCGSGLAGVEFKRRTARMVGIDLSPEMVELARARNIYDRLDVAEITDWLARCEETFDLIVACDTLIYFGDLLLVVPAAAKLLRPGGIFAFTLERGERFPFHLADSGRYTHHPDHIREAAAKAGLRVERLEESFLRMEYGQEVTGLFAILVKDALAGL
jgi:predicted TPR repeat methyltransferase